jgi:hypothetical protein
MRIFLCLTGLFICVPGAFAAAAQVEDDQGSNGAPAAGIARPGDAAILGLAAKSQTLAGIKTQILVSARQQPEAIVYGTVLNPEPLLQLRQQYLTAHAQQDSAKAKFTETHLNLSRTQNLHNQDIVSTRRLQEQQAQWQADKANFDASGYQQQNILAASRMAWGDILTNCFIVKQNKAAEDFLQHKVQLLQITLPTGAKFADHTSTILIDERGERANAIEASLISKSPRVDPLTQGESYFFKVKARLIPFGAHITAWITENNGQLNGVDIPKSALVWHLGQAFVFIKSADQHFTLRALANYTPSTQGYFVMGSLQAGEEIVTTGAQTLLSQHLKALIPSEDKD